MLPSDEIYLNLYFTYHPPKSERVNDFGIIREEAGYLARTILVHVPACAERTLALRAVEEAVMRANQAIIIADAKKDLEYAESNCGRKASEGY